MSDNEIDLDREFDVITREAVIDVEITGILYQRIKELFSSLQQHDPKKFIETVIKLKDNEAADVYEYNISTLIILIELIEKAAHKQEKTSKTTLRFLKEQVANLRKDET